MITRAMLAASAVTLSELRTHFPECVLASPKLDGIRCIIHPDLGAVSRNFKPIPNNYIREILNDFKFMDGEIVTYTNKILDDFNTIQSKVMRQTGMPDFKLLSFDYFKSPDLPFIDRYDKLLNSDIRPSYHRTFESPVHHKFIVDSDTFINYAGTMLNSNYEGAMYRNVDGKYKSGRSTLRQGWLVKWKDVQDAEGSVVGFIEQMHNNNESTVNLTGMQEKSSHKENMEYKNTLGALVLDTSWGELRVGTGFDDVTRKRIWKNKVKYLGKTVTFKYQPYGTKNLPRFPVFKTFREKE
jgi:DNA ligase-1